MAARALKMYVASICPFCQRAEIAAREAKVAYERILVGLGPDMPDWYKKINPRETVPTLIDGEKTVFESLLISRYMNDIGMPKGALMGENAVQQHKIELFLSRVGEWVSACYSVLRDPFNAVKRNELDEKAKCINSIVAANQTTGPFYCDNVFTMADVAIVPFLVRFKTVMMYYAGYDVFAKAPQLKLLWAAAVQRESVQSTSLSPTEYIAAFTHVVPPDSLGMLAGGRDILYGNKYCPFVDRVRLACAAKGLQPYWVEVPLRPLPLWYEYMNSRETVPTFMTREGEFIHESQLIVQYVDRAVEGGRALIPADPTKAYDVYFLADVASNLIDAVYGYINNSASADAKAELEYWAGEASKAIGDGPFHGGAQMDAGDISLLPVLVRMEVYQKPGEYDALAAFPALRRLLDAGRASEEAKSIFLSVEEYRAPHK